METLSPSRFGGSARDWGFPPSLSSGGSSGGCGRVGRYARRPLAAAARLVPLLLVFIWQVFSSLLSLTQKTVSFPHLVVLLPLRLVFGFCALELSHHRGRTSAIGGSSGPPSVRIPPVPFCTLSFVGVLFGSLVLAQLGHVLVGSGLILSGRRHSILVIGALLVHSVGASRLWFLCDIPYTSSSHTSVSLVCEVGIVSLSISSGIRGTVGRLVF